MTIFLILNGMGLVFLLYVLAGFWEESHRPAGHVRKNAIQFGSEEMAQVAVTTYQISRPARDFGVVIPFQAPRQFDRKLVPVASINAGRELSAGSFAKGEKSWGRETPFDTPAVMKKGRQC